MFFQKASNNNRLDQNLFFVSQPKIGQNYVHWTTKGTTNDNACTLTTCGRKNKVAM